MPRRAEHWHVLGLDAFGRLPEQQPTAAHVSPADELERKPQPVPNIAEKSTYRRGDAAEQDNVAVRANLPGQHPRAALERHGEAGIVLMTSARQRPE